MVFSSATFLFLFLPLFLVGYYALPPRFRTVWILAGSWLFYAWWRPDFLLLLVFAASVGWFVGTRIAALRIERPRAARRWVALGVGVALGVLAYFKYFNFGVSTLSALLGTVGAHGFSAWHVVLPIGISFYTFQLVSYVVDVYRGVAPPARTFVEVAAYVSLFPQLVAGPIVRYGEIADELRSREHSWHKFDEGARRFMIGLARKVLIADAVAPLADAVFAAAAPGLAAAWLGLVAYTVQIYFDFAAYSDMAVGMGRMLGFTFPENFDCPYHARTITEFWRRWHMTLSRWLRDYLYIPLGGSRRGDRRTLVNLMTVMALGGLWHGAAWSFVLWGVWHGLWLVAERASGLRLRRAGTLLVVMFGWVLFRAETSAGAIDVFRSLFGGAGPGVADAVAWQVDTGSLVALALGVGVASVEPWLRASRVGSASDPAPTGSSAVARPRIDRSVMERLCVYAVFSMSLVRVIAASFSPFLYFQF